MKAAPISVLLVDDHEVVRAGYRRLLEATADITVVAEADNGESACRSYFEYLPDVLIMDISMAGIDLGITVPGCKDEIVVVSRQNNSGTYAYFKETILGEGGKYRQGTLDMQGSKDVVDLVEKTPCAIGYSGLAYATDSVKMVCVAATDAEDCISPSVATASDRSYPIARPLFMYTDGEPKGEIKNYLDWITSDAGQCILLKKGYAPIHDVKCD